MRVRIYDRLGETVYSERLKNGLQVIVVPKPGFARSYAAFAVRYGGMDTRFSLGGEWLDTPMGIAHYLEHKMFDTKEGNALQELAQNGAEPNAFTANSMTVYYFDSTEKFEDNLKILLSFVSVPWFTDESVEKERGIISQEIRMGEDNPDHELFQMLLQALYSRSTARNPIAGTVESIADISAGTLYDCHRAFYTPSNMVLIVVGAVDPEHIADLARRVTSEVKGEEIPRDYGEEPETPAAAEMTRTMAVAIPKFAIGFKGKPVPDGPDYYRTSLVGELACTALLGDSSPLYQRLYEDGLVNSSFEAAYEILPGISFVFASGESRESERVRDEIISEADRLLREGIPQDVWQRLSRAAYGSSLRGLNHFESIALSFADGSFHGYDPFTFPEVYSSITPDDVLSFIKEHFTPAQTTLCRILPPE